MSAPPFLPDDLHGQLRVQMGRLLRESSLTNVQAAERIGVTERTLRRWVRGHTEPRLVDVEAFFSAFGKRVVISVENRRD